MAATLPVQQEIASALRQPRVTYLVLYNGCSTYHEQTAAATSRGATYLDDVIRQEYEQVEEMGRYAIWRRRT